MLNTKFVSLMVF